VTSPLSANNTGTLGARVYVCLNLIHPLCRRRRCRRCRLRRWVARRLRVHVTPKESDDATRCLIIEKQFGDVKIITRGRRDSTQTAGLPWAGWD